MEFSRILRATPIRLSADPHIINDWKYQKRCVCPIYPGRLSGRGFGVPVGEIYSGAGSIVARIEPLEMAIVRSGP